MAYCLTYNCGADWEDYIPGECGAFFLGGMSASILFRCGVQTDDVLTADQVDETKVNALLASGDAKLVTGIRLSLEAPSGVTTDSYVACQTDIAVTYDRTITWQDRNVTPENVTFYNSINAASGFQVGGALIRECDAARITYVDSVMTFNGGRISPPGAEMQRFEFTVSYRATGDAPIYEDVPGIFE